MKRTDFTKIRAQLDKIEEAELVEALTKYGNRYKFIGKMPVVFGLLEGDGLFSHIAIRIAVAKTGEGVELWGCPCDKPDAEPRLVLILAEGQYGNITMMLPEPIVKLTLLYGPKKLVDLVHSGDVDGVKHFRKAHQGQWVNYETTEFDSPDEADSFILGMQHYRVTYDTPDFAVLWHDNPNHMKMVKLITKTN